MKAPDFWWQAEPTRLARLLDPIGRRVGAMTVARMAEPGLTLPVPVICVGNPTVGGAGKTPTVAALRRLLTARGERPVIVSRGYGGQLVGPELVDPAVHGAADVGDEPLMLAADGPVVVARQRAAGGLRAIVAGASVVLMDDGLQNPQIAKTMSLAVVDAAVGFGNGLCLPAGPLRAPLAAQWPAIDAVVLVGEGPSRAQVTQLATRAGKPVLSARLQPDAAVAEALRGREIAAFCGIGRPGKFRETLEAIGARIAWFKAFPDHHPFSASDARTLTTLAARHPLVTTQKDAARLPATLKATLGDRLVVLPVALVFDDPRIEQMLDDALTRAREEP